MKTNYYAISLILFIAIIYVWLFHLQSNVEIDTSSGAVISASADIHLIAPDEVVEGTASWYKYSLKGYPNYSKNHLTCASRDFKRGSMLTVMYGDKSVVCRVNDFGPEEWTGRIIDLSSYAFSKLAPLKLGILEQVKIINN